MTVCKANEVRTELMKTRCLPETNEAYFVPITLQIEKSCCSKKKGKKKRYKEIKEEGKNYF